MIRKRKQSKKITNKSLIQNVGGSLIDPPEECQYRRKYSLKEGDIWADLGCCQACCENKCDRFLWFCKVSTQERIQDLVDHGVYYDKNWLGPDMEIIYPEDSEEEIEEKPIKRKRKRK